jgi:hypothetical protein
VDLSFQPLQDLVTLIRAQEVRADTDPAKVTTPGAWVTVENIRYVSLGREVVLDAVVYLVAPDRDHRRAMDTLAGLHNAIIPSVLVPDGPVVPQGLILPDNPTHPLPALRVPVTLTEA